MTSLSRVWIPNSKDRRPSTFGGTAADGNLPSFVSGTYAVDSNQLGQISLRFATVNSPGPAAEAVCSR